MTSKQCLVNDKLRELNSKYEALNKSINERNEMILLKNKYVRKNMENEEKLKRLYITKERLEYLKGVLYRDLFRNSIYAGQSKISLSQKVEEYHRKNESTKGKLQKLPGVLILQELIEDNEKLNIELQQLSELLVKVTREYSVILHNAERNFVEKVINFSSEFLQRRKLEEEDKKKLLVL